MRTLIALTSLLATAPAHAGKIADLFSDGMFGLPWGATRQEIVERFPNGQWKKQANIESYVARDDRAVLGIKRSAKDEISFVLSSEGRLQVVQIQFPSGQDNFGLLLQHAQEAFGPFRERAPDEMVSQLGDGATLKIDWEDDQGIKVYLVNETRVFGKGKIYLNLVKTDLGTMKSKEELGFE